MVAFLVMAGLFSSVDTTPADMAEAQRWVAASFQGNAGAAPSGPAIEVITNFGPVQPDGRSGTPLRFGHEGHRRGLYCHAPSHLVVHLPGPARSFEALAGIDSNDQTVGGRGSAAFVVEAGGAVAFRSDLQREGMPPVPVKVDLGGVSDFVLRIEDGGENSCDQADWAEARVTLADGATVWLSDLPLTGQGMPDYPAEPFFSFVYDGQPSASFIKDWPVERATHELDENRTEHVITYTDPKTQLSIRCVGIAYRDYPVVEWTCYLKNGGASDSPMLETILPLDMRLTRDPYSEFVLHSNRGDRCTADSYEPFVDTLGPNSAKRVANTGGRPTQEAFPYFNIEWASRGMICVVSWAGAWTTEFACEGERDLHITAGQELTHFVLHPGEEVRTPMIVLLFWKGDWMRGQNVWRRWMFAHTVPQPGGAPLAPMLSLCTGNYYPNLMTESVKEREFLERHLAEQIPFDCWWQDAGWYPCDGVGWPKTGTWEVDPVRFPKGLRELSDLMHAHGKRTMVWFEPERVHPDTWLTENHPEWIHGGKGGGLLKLSDPACRVWLTDHIDRVMAEQGIDYYRQDFNMDPLPFWRAADAENRQGITEIRHVDGYHAYWDELLRRHPGMLIDSCASGGRRNDLETLRRSVPLLRSDWYWSPAGQQCQTYGLSMWIPYHGTGFIYPKDEYWIRSSMTPENSFGPCTDGLDNVNFPELLRLTRQCKQVAPCFLGDYYPLAKYTPDESVWMAWQFNRPGEGDGVVQVFRRIDSAYEASRYPLYDLDPAAMYAIQNLDEPEGQVTKMPGQALMDTGLPVSITEKPKAVVLMYKKVEQ